MLIPPQVKLTLAAVALASFLGLGWGVKHLYTQNVKMEGDLEDAKAHIKGWGEAYASAAEERQTVDKDLAKAEGEKDQAQRHASALERELERIAKVKGGECAKTNAPAEYTRALIDGLPSRRRQAAIEGDTADRSGEIPDTDSIP